MRRARAGAALLAAAFAFPGVAWSQAGRTVGDTLRRAGAARPAGLGETFVALSGDLQGASYNPAGLALLGDPELDATYLRGFADDTTGAVSYAHPLPWGALYAGAVYFDAGKIELNFSNGVRETRTAQRDTVGMAGIALGRTGPFSLGLVGKGFRFELAEEASASGAAVDAGVQWRSPLSWLTLGGSVLNAGSDVRFEVEEEPLPLTYRAGAAVTLDFIKMFPKRVIPYQVILVGESVTVRKEGGGVHAGLEIRRMMATNFGAGHAALRGGYLSEAEAFTIGAGGRLGRLNIDFAVYVYDDIDSAQRLTVGFLFGDPEEEDTKPRRGGRRRLDDPR